MSDFSETRVCPVHGRYAPDDGGCGCDEEETTFCPRCGDMVPLEACRDCPLWDADGYGCGECHDERG